MREEKMKKEKRGLGGVGVGHLMSTASSTEVTFTARH